MADLREIEIEVCRVIARLLDNGIDADAFQFRHTDKFGFGERIVTVRITTPDAEAPQLTGEVFDL